MSELTRVSGVHSHQQTWAVHDDKVCVYLSVTATGRFFSGVFMCVAYSDGQDCPWLGSCETDAFLSTVARPIYQAAAESGFDEDTIYPLLEELLQREIAGVER